MNVLIYADAGNRAGYRLEKSIRAELEQVKTVLVVHSMQNVREVICRPLCGISAVIVFLTKKTPLDELAEIKSVLSDLRIIVVLPDDDEDFVARSLKLQPTFLSYEQRGFSDVLAVLGKVASKRKNNFDI